MHAFLQQWNPHRTPALQSALMVVLGIFIAENNPLPLPSLPWPLLAVTGSFFAIVLIHKKRIISYALFCLLGLCATNHENETYKKSHASKEHLFSTLHYVAPPSYKKNEHYRQKVLLKPQNILTIAKLTTPLLPGQTVSGIGSLTCDTTPIRPWETRRITNRQKGVHGTLTLTTLNSSTETGTTKLYRNIQRKLAHLPSSIRSLYQATLLGERYRLTPRISAALKEAGMAHFIAISGLHIGLLSGFVLILLSLLPLPQSVRNLMALLLSWGIIFITGPTASTVRALIMISVFLAAPLLQRRALSLNTLGVAATLYLLLFPLHLFTIGFQLSFAATGAIIATLPLTRPLAKWPKRVVSPLVITGVAQLATTPFLAGSFGAIAPVGILFNLIALPLFALLLQAVALLLCIPHEAVLQKGMFLVDMSTTFLLHNVERVLLATDWGLIDCAPLPSPLLLIGTPLLTIVFCGTKNVVIPMIYTLILATTFFSLYTKHSDHHRKNTLLIINETEQLENNTQTPPKTYTLHIDPKKIQTLKPFLQWYAKEKKSALVCIASKNGEAKMREILYEFPSISPRFHRITSETRAWQMIQNETPKK